MSKKEFGTEEMSELARVITNNLPEDQGFIIMTAPFGEGKEGRLHYSTNMSRDTVINVLKEWLEIVSNQSGWMKHLN